MRVPLKSNIAFKSAHELKKLIPASSTVSSFFLYDGQLESSLAATNRQVVAHTNRYAIYEFWMHLLSDRHVLADAAAHLFPTIDDTQYYLLQEDWTTYKDPLMRAALFFILNRSSEAGLVSCGELRRENFNPAAFALLKSYEISNLYPKYDKDENVLSTIAQVPPSDYLLLPVGKYNLNLFDYGKGRGPEITHIHHRKLYQMVNEMERKVILLYKKHPTLFTIYNNYNIRMIDTHGRLTSDKEACEEMIIANF
jgi:hypothetical protein